VCVHLLVVKARQVLYGREPRKIGHCAKDASFYEPISAEGDGVIQKTMRCSSGDSLVARFSNSLLPDASLRVLAGSFEQSPTSPLSAGVRLPECLMQLIPMRRAQVLLPWTVPRC